VFVVETDDTCRGGSMLVSIRCLALHSRPRRVPVPHEQLRIKTMNRQDGLSIKQPQRTGKNSRVCAGKIVSPTIFRERGYRFFFFSREEKRMHVHVLSGDGEAKFWLEPEIELAKNHRYSRRQLKEIELLIEVHYNELIGAWKQHFSS